MTSASASAADTVIQDDHSLAARRLQHCADDSHIVRTYVIDAALMTLPREPRTEPDMVLPAQRHLVQSTSVVASGGHTLQSEDRGNT